MKTRMILLLPVLPFILWIRYRNNGTEPDSDPDLTDLFGDYLGQALPGNTPVRFTPDILLPEGTQILFTLERNFIESTCDPFSLGHPVKFNFLDKRYQLIYKKEQRIGTIILYFTILAVLISCLGLFGLTSFITEQRTKEIGIRKVLGSSVSNIVALLGKNFVQWILLANLISWPIAYLIMEKWLQNYAYRIDLTILPFILSGLSSFFIALLTVIWKTVTAALANPINTLRYE